MTAFSSDYGFDHEILSRVSDYQEVMSKLWGKEIDGSNASSSGDFSNTSRELINRKLTYFGLDNIEIFEGDFKITLKDKSLSNRPFMCANIDCDLYEGYCEGLKFIWPKLSDGGFVHLDEYYSLKFPGARIAVDEFCRQNGICVTKQKSRSGEFPRVSLRK